MPYIDKDIVTTQEERNAGDLALVLLVIGFGLLLFRAQWIIDNPFIASFLTACAVGGYVFGGWLKNHPKFQTVEQLTAK